MLPRFCCCSIKLCHTLKTRLPRFSCCSIKLCHTSKTRLPRFSCCSIKLCHTSKIMLPRFCCCSIKLCHTSETNRTATDHTLLRSKRWELTWNDTCLWWWCGTVHRGLVCTLSHQKNNISSRVSSDPPHNEITNTTDCYANSSWPHVSLLLVVYAVLNGRVVTTL